MAAAVAAVAAPSAVAPAAVAAVLAVILAIIFPANPTKLCPNLIVDDIPFATFPNPTAAGPTAATIAPVVTTFCFCSSLKDVNHFDTSCIFPANSLMTGAAPVIIVDPRSDAASFTLFIASLASSFASVILL